MAEKKIGKRTFRAEPLLARDAIVLQARLIKFMGGAAERLPQIIAGFQKGASDGAKDSARVAAIAAITDCFAKVEPEAVADLMSDIVSGVQVKRPSGTYDPCDLDGDFSGTDMKDLMPVILFALSETYGDFFAVALASGSPRIAAGAH